MESFRNWWKRDNRALLLGKAVLMALLPICCCLVYCIMRGKGIGEVYLPASEWNDELFYFKQTESILKFGYPQGYFGFNESHALKLSFAAWSPVLLLPWVLWGLVFGWNLMSPIYCNIFLLTAAVFCFIWLTRPTWKQMGVLTLLFCLYTPFVRYMLSGMPEITCFSLLIVFYGLAIHYLERESAGKLALLFAISGLLVLMRPYMLLFMMLPSFLWIRKSKWKGAAGAGAIVAAIFGSYVLIKHYLGAEYFTPLFFTDWIVAFGERGILGGLRNICGTIHWVGKDFLKYTVDGFRDGLASGAFFGGYLVMMAVFLWQSAADFGKLRKVRDSEDGRQLKSLQNQVLIEGHLAFCYVSMLIALLLMYKLEQGARHLLTFIAASIFVVSRMDTKAYKKAVLVGAVFAYLYSYKATNPYDYQVPFVTGEAVAKQEKWKAVFEREIILREDGVPNFDNVMIWVLADIVEDSMDVLMTDWQIFYTLPEGMGISCCQNSYVLEHIGELRSPYLTLPIGGITDAACQEAGYRELARDDDMAVYVLREIR